MAASQPLSSTRVLTASPGSSNHVYQPRKEQQQDRQYTVCQKRNKEILSPHSDKASGEVHLASEQLIVLVES